MNYFKTFLFIFICFFFNFQITSASEKLAYLNIDLVFQNSITGKNIAKNWYRKSSVFNTTFYGQLASAKINKNDFKVKNSYTFSEEDYKKLLKTVLARAGNFIFVVALFLYLYQQ